MANYTKPIPAPNKETQKFWEGCKRGELMIPQCGDCGAYHFYPRALCPACLSSNLDWVAASGKGKVHTFSVVHRAPSEPFKADVPYTIALLELDEGVRMMSNIIHCKPEAVRIGMEVRVVFEEITEAIALPKFEPIP